MNLLDLMIKVGIEDNVTDGLDSIVSSAKSAASAVGSALSTAAKIGGVVAGGIATATGAVAKAAVDNYADYEQLVGGVETLFKDSAAAVQAYADTAFRTSGLSANEYMDTVTSFSASLLQSLGGDTAAAADAAQEAIVDMADNANKMGTSIESIQNAYQGFAKQNYSMLDNLKLGYGGTQQEMYRLMETAAALDETFAATAEFSLDAKGRLTAEFADITKAIHIVQTEMGITGTTAQEAASTISGSMASAKSAWQNFLTGLADENADLSGLTDNLVDSVAVAAENILPRVGQAIDGILTAFSELTGIDLSGFANSVSSAVSGVVGTMQELISAFQADGITGAVDMLVGKFQQLTGIDLSGFAGTVQSVFTDLSSAVSEFASAKLKNAVTAIKSITAPFVGALPGIIESVKTAFNGFLGVITGFETGGTMTTFAESIGTMLAPFVEKLPRIIAAVGDAFNGFLGFAAGVASGPLATVADAIVKLFSPFVSGVAELIIWIGEALAEIFAFADSTLSEPLQKLADAMVELFSPFSKYLVEWVTKVAEAVGGLIQSVIKKGVTIVADFAEELGNVLDCIKPIWENFLKAVDVIVDFIAALVDSKGKAKDAGYAIGKLLGDAANLCIETWNGVIEFFKGLPDNLVAAFDGIGAKFAEIGANIVAGIKSGIENAWKGLKEFVSGLWDGLTGQSEEDNEIHSPSRVYARIGSYLAQGVGVGWAEAFPAVERLVQSSYDRLADVGATVGTVRFSDSVVGKSSSGIANTIIASSERTDAETQMQQINLVVDGMTLATVVVDPLRGIMKQKGGAALA